MVVCTGLLFLLSTVVKHRQQTKVPFNSSEFASNYFMEHESMLFICRTTNLYSFIAY